MSDVHDLPENFYAVETEADDFLPKHALKSKPAGLPDNVNFVTDELLGYWEAEDGTGAEISTGMMLFARCIGVTFPQVFSDQDNWMPNPRNCCCWSWTEVRVALGYGDGEP